MPTVIPKTIFVIDADSVVVLTKHEPKHNSFTYYRFDDQYNEAVEACEEIAKLRRKRISDFLHSDTDQPKIYDPSKTILQAEPNMNKLNHILA